MKFADPEKGAALDADEPSGRRGECGSSSKMLGMLPGKKNSLENNSNGCFPGTEVF